MVKCELQLIKAVTKKKKKKKKKKAPPPKSVTLWVLFLIASPRPVIAPGAE